MKKNNFPDLLLNKPSGAQFFRCALQVNPFSYAKYRGLASIDELAYNKGILNNCLKENIQVVGLADHGDINESERLRRFLEQNDIIVFPGIELCSSEKVHMVCLFPSEYTVDKLNQILGALQGGAVKDDEKTYPSKKTVISIAKLVEEHGGVFYAAHITHDSGLLKLYRDGGGLKHIWREEKYILAGQIPESIEQLEEKFKQIILNKNPDYKRINLISVLNAKDIDKPETLLDKRATSLIKMDRPTIEALRQAFLDGISRIRLNDTIESKKRSYIKAIKIDSPFFGDGLTLNFNKNLNSVIGGRGTGKSTILECIRYGLGLSYHANNSKILADGILKENLVYGKVTILVSSQRFERDFFIERHYGQPVTVKDENGNVSNLAVRDILPSFEFFGQNEIYEISNDKSYHL
ncbi:MAG: AAA family ATPase, partial [Ignavibacteria bacterium]|nr:AAA family ATPase [Ignavibacteria bacterium]